MSLQYIRDTYQVPAKRGGRVAFTGNGPRREGTIIGASSQYLRVRLEGDDFVAILHPTWQLEYLAATPKES